MARLRQSLSCLLLCLCLARAEVFSAEGVASLTAFIVSKAGSGGQYGSSVESAYYATTALAALGSAEQLDKASLCSLAAESSKDSAASTEQLFYAAKIASALSCTNQLDSTKAATTALAALKSARSVEEFYHSVGTLAALHRDKQLPKSASPAQIAEQAQPAWKVLQRLILSNGLVRPQSGQPTSIQATGRMYMLLADARNELRLDLPSETVSAVDDLWAAIPKVLDGATIKGLSAGGDTDGLAAVASWLQGAAAVQATGLDAIQLGHLARVLVASKDAASLEQASYIAKGLEALRAKSFPQLLEITLLTPALPVDSQRRLQVLVTDFAGETVQGASVQAASVNSASQSVLTNAAFKDQGQGAYELDVLGQASTTPGPLALTVTAKASGGGAGKADLRVLLTDSLQLSPVSVSVESSDSPGTAQSLSVSHPKPITDDLSLEPSESVKVALSITAAASGSSFAPQQSMLRLTHLHSGSAAYFVAKGDKGAEGEVVITVKSSAIEKQIGLQSGQYQATLLIGDEAATSPITWDIFSIDVSHPSRDDGSPALPPSPRASAAASQALPEITHLFRTPAARPPATVSYLFTGLALAPLGVLLLMLGSIGVNFKGFPTTGGKLVATLGFQGSMVAILALYLVFWFRLDLITMLPILAGLLVLAALFGYNALSSHGAGHIKSQ